MGLTEHPLHSLPSCTSKSAGGSCCSVSGLLKIESSDSASFLSILTLLLANDTLLRLFFLNDIVRDVLFKVRAISCNSLATNCVLAIQSANTVSLFFRRAMCDNSRNAASLTTPEST